jgi:hypothetical protein
MLGKDNEDPSPTAAVESLLLGGILTDACVLLNFVDFLGPVDKLRLVEKLRRKVNGLVERTRFEGNSRPHIDD